MAPAARNRGAHILRGAVTAASGSLVSRSSLPWGRSMAAAAERLTRRVGSPPYTGERRFWERNESWGEPRLAACGCAAGLKHAQSSYVVRPGGPTLSQARLLLRSELQVRASEAGTRPRSALTLLRRHHGDAAGQE
jgi:hypothetical protein